MCGIAGIVSKNIETNLLGLVRTMTDAIAHRGPDGEGCWHSVERSVGLGHRRLSIIDLSHQGDQPMHYMDRYTIVFNGEIYNYIELKEELKGRGYNFHSHSDTEVLLALYDYKKEKCLKDLDGMFAFAIFDKKENKLFCARDRFGEKPFYYYFDSGNRFLFASEMKALWAAGVPRDYDMAMVYNFILKDAVSNPENPSATFYNGIKKLPNSTYMVLDVRSLQYTLKTYWSLEAGAFQPEIAERNAIEKFRELFYDSVKMRLRSDVPVGSSLSGGIDSSVVVSVIKKIQEEQNSNAEMNTFSARFPKFSADESYYQDLVIQQNKLVPHFIYPDNNSLEKNFQKLIYHQEEPFSTLSIGAQFEVYSKAREKGIPVLLDGQGADEMLAGYPFYYYSFLNEQRLISAKQYSLALQSVQNTYGELNTAFLPDKFVNRLKLYLPQSLVRILKKRTAEKETVILNKDFSKEYGKSRFYVKTEFTNLNEALANSMMQSGLQDLLRFADRNSMAHAIEVRLPFLSHKLVNFVFGLPPTMKIKDGYTKWILRQSMEQLLPAPIAWRSDKIGYATPYIKPENSNWYNALVHESIEELKKDKIIAPSFIVGSPMASEKKLLKMVLIAKMRKN